MASRRLPLALLWPSGLVLLVGVLAFFQYKWLGQVSESERDRLRTTLNQRAREFADDFDREIGSVYAALSVNDDTVRAGDWEAVAKRYDAWKAASRFPQLVRNVYLTGGTDAGALLQFDPGARTFRPATWPAELDLVKERLRPLTSTHTTQPDLPGAIRFVSVAATAIVADVPAILAPVQTTQRLITIDRRMSLPTPMPTPTAQTPRFVVIELDRAFMQTTMLSSLVERHFTADDYHVAVADQRTPDAPFFTKGVQSPSTIRLKDADASIPFFSLHVDLMREALATLRPAGTTVAGFPIGTAAPSAMLSATPSGRFSIVVQESSTVAAAAAATGVRTANVQYTNGGAWQIVLQHPAGSLEAAVSRARLRNLSLSFGVLAVLAASVFLISINAQRAQRLAAQQMDFVATVSHELRTPLAVIRSAAQNLSAGVVHEPGQAKRYGDLIDAEGKRLTDMVEQVLTYAGMSDSKRPATTAPTDIVTVTRDVVASCDGLIREAGFAVDVTTPEAMADVPLDEAAYRRALNNLIVNALKYGTDGRWLGVSVAMAAGKGGAPEVQVAVSDRGRGIDAADLPHIFEAFYRGTDAKDRQIHGNGLGLSLVKGIAEAHGGRVTVQSTPGAGATFMLHLPA